MENLKSKLRKIALASAALLALTAPAFAISSNEAFVAEVRETSIPMGHAAFCKTRPDECARNGSFLSYEVLTQ